MGGQTQEASRKGPKLSTCKVERSIGQLGSKMIKGKGNNVGMVENMNVIDLEGKKHERKTLKEHTKHRNE